jgi:5,5'-dehydrodivanillate O-demethylase oxygenase subunit
MIKQSWNDDWNHKYTSVSKNSLSGILLRKYWHPVLLSTDIPSRTLKKVKLLGESLIVFRLSDGRLSVLPENCPHRGASLAYGFIEKDGIRCAYHGWKFAVDGNLVDAPFSSYLLNENCNFDKQWNGKIYECGGIIFICLSPEDKNSMLPNWDILLSGAEEIVVQRHEVNCNWFQYQENAADITHTLFLHGAKLRSLGIPDSSGFFSQLVWYSHSIKSFGLVKAWLYENREVGWGNLAVFPNILRIREEMHWRVPLTDDKTLIFQVSGRSLSNQPKTGDESNILCAQPLRAISIESPPVHNRDNDEFNLWSFQGQDAAACVTQGTFARRHQESLVTSDYGVVLYRNAWQKLCDEGLSPNLIYEELTLDNIIDIRPWLGGNDIAASRPISKLNVGANSDWSRIFDGSESLIMVPRGSAGKGPLG